MTAVTSSDQAVVQSNLKLPYAPSWVDRLTAAVDRLPGPVVLYSVGLAVLVTVIGALVRWRDGALPAGTFPLFYVVALSTPAYYLALIHYLDKFAAQSFHEFRPTLAIGDSEAEVLLYQLTTMPARETLLVTLAGIAVAIVGIYGIAAGVYLAELALFSSPLSTIFAAVLVLANFPVLFVFMYHAKHQLWTINLILSRCTNVNLFRQAPLYIFPRLTARTAVSLIAMGYLWIATQPGATSDVSTVVISALVAATGFAAFVWPFWGVHRVLVGQKQSAVDVVTQRLHAALDELHRRIDDARFEDVSPPIQAVTALRQELEMLERIPTWPWRPETIRGVLSALVLPVLLWMTTRVLERVLTL